jgi:DNA replication protein DnaC
MLDHIQNYCEKLKLLYIKDAAESEAKSALERSESHLDFLENLLRQEVLTKESRSIESKIKKAKFPFIKTKDDFDFKALENLDISRLNELFKGNYVEKKSERYYAWSIWYWKNALGHYLRAGCLESG